MFSSFLVFPFSVSHFILSCFLSFPCFLSSPSSSFSWFLTLSPLSFSPLLSFPLLLLPPLPSPLLIHYFLSSLHICSFLLASIQISPFLLFSSSLSVPFSSPCYLSPSCFLAHSLSPFVFSPVLTSYAHLRSSAHLSRFYLVVFFFISSSFSLSSSPCSLSSLSSPSLFPLCPVLLSSFPPGLLVPSPLLTPLSPPVPDTLPPLLSDTFPPSIRSPPLCREEEEEEEEEDRFFCPRALTAEQLSDHSIVFLPVCSSATDRQSHSSSSSLLCRLPTRTMHQTKNPDCLCWPIRRSKLRVVLGQEGSRTENTDVRLNRNLKIHLSVCKFWFLSFFLFPSLSLLLVLALKSSLSAWFFWGSAEVFVTALQQKTLLILLARRHQFRWCFPSLLRLTSFQSVSQSFSPSLSLSLALPPSSSVCFSGLSWTKCVRSEYSDRSGFQTSKAWEFVVCTIRQLEVTKLSH